MDLRKFILYHKSHQSIDSFVDGFERSSFVDPTNEIPNLIKQILPSPKLIGDLEKQKLYNQLQSGGVASTKTDKNETQKKQSFCTEFNQMILNILGLLGFDFSKYLFFLFGMRKILLREIDYIKEARTYEDILTHIIYINNIFSLGENSPNISTEESPLDIDENFYTSYFDDDEYNQIFQSQSVSSSDEELYINIEVKNKKTILFEYLINEIKKLVKVENILSFEDDKREWLELLNLVVDNLIIRSYSINTIDDLILNLGRYNVVYDKSFIKMFDVLYEESFVQIPPDFRSNIQPHVLFIEKELGLDVKCSRYIAGFNKYFHKIFDETLKTTIELMPIEDVLTLNISDEFYDRLSNITLNLYVQICKKIANNQQVYTFVGRSTRIQFSQVLSAVMDCAPRNTIFTRSQFATIYFVLLSRKVLHESVKIVCEMN